MPIAMCLRAYDGLYVGAQNGGGGQIDARRSIPREHETFSLFDPPEKTQIKGRDKITLQTYDGHYIMAVNSGGGEVNAVSNQGSVWETFTILRQDGSEGEITNGDKADLSQ
jgi:hypothetical protein